MTDDVGRQALLAAGVPDDKIDDLLDMERMRNEALHPDLAPYVCVEDTIGTVLKHPLVYQVPLWSSGIANRYYMQKSKALIEAQDEGNWSKVIWLHERAYRCNALIDYVVGRDDLGRVIPLVLCTGATCDLAADVWVDSENIHQHVGDWAAMFSDWECGDDMLFNDSPDEWAALPDTLTVYRAGIDDGGWSWTSDPKIVEFFARRFGDNHPMTVARVSKSCVFGYLTRRSESEVLIPDGSVFAVRSYLV